MRWFVFLIIVSFFSRLLSESQNLDEPLSNKSWSKFGPLSQHYIIGRKEKPDAVYSILKSYVSSSAHILDLGSGTGISTRQLCNNGFRSVIGVDRDLQMIQEARAGNSKIGPIKYIQADITLGLPFADEQFDVVTAVSAFHWFSNPSSSKEVARILKPNGYYFIIGGKSRYQESKKPNLVKEHIEQLIQECQVEVTNYKSKSPLISDVLEEQGFKIIVDASVPYVNSYTKDEYLHRVQSQTKWNRVRESQRAALLKRIDQYLDTVIDKEGLIKKEGCVAVVLAQKVKKE